MGRYKEHSIEMDDQIARGFVLPGRGDKQLCSTHYRDPFLRNLIKENGVFGTCSYCGQRTMVLDLCDFVEYVGNKLADGFEDVDNAGLFLEHSFYDSEDEQIPGYKRVGGYIAPEDADYYESNEDVMSDYGLLSDNDNLNDDLSNCLHMEHKIRRNPTCMMLSDEMSLMWKDFCHLVKGERRFTFFHSPMFENANPENSDNGLLDILTEIGSVIHAAETKIKAGTKLYRCRPAGKSEKVAEFKDITSPPVFVAKSNRLSPVGISMFYGSFDSETPYAETKNYETTPKDYYIGRFHTTQDLIVVDLTSLQASFWMPSQWQETLFLIRFHKEISKPLGKKDTEVEYVPSQIFIEYLRYLCRSSHGVPFDGIIYRSSLTSQLNIALFYDNEASGKILELEEITKH